MPTERWSKATPHFEKRVEEKKPSLLAEGLIEIQLRRCEPDVSVTLSTVRIVDLLTSPGRWSIATSSFTV